MKHVKAAGMILLIGMTSVARAESCRDAGYSNRLNATNIGTALSGNRVLAKAPNGEEWNEDHCAAGALYKVGAGTAVDPRVYRGSWETVESGGNSTVRYRYTVGGTLTFDWTLWRNASTGNLCWEDSSSAIVAIAPAPGSIPSDLSCSTP